MVLGGELDVDRFAPARPARLWSDITAKSVAAVE